MLTVKIDAKDAVRQLETFKRSALKFAIRDALNTSAFEAQRIWRREIAETFINRNQFTVRSILVEKAKLAAPDSMFSAVGSIAKYMDEQESGGIVRGRGAHKPIPAPTAAGQPPGSKRTKLVLPSRYLSAIQAVRPPKGASAKQRNVVAMLMARRKGQKFVLLERPGGGRGLFLVAGGTQRFNGTKFVRRALRARLVWDLSRGSVRVPPAPTLQRTLAALEPKLESIYLAALVAQCHRHGIFKL